ncbi:hypothetical protein D050_3038A, partial [Vibrio parahaemolyticus VPCR-2009]
MFFIYGHFN